MIFPTQSPHAAPMSIVNAAGSESRVQSPNDGRNFILAGRSHIRSCLASRVRNSYTRKIIESIWHHNERCPDKTYYFQSKQPKYFESFTDQFPDNVIVLTTLETNRDDDNRKVSKAQPPSERYRQLYELSYPRKVVTTEPVIDFDPDIFLRWIVDLNPEYIWLGFNSRPKQVVLPEPDKEKMQQFIKMLQDENIRIMGKELRGLETLLKVKEHRGHSQKPR